MNNRYFHIWQAVLLLCLMMLTGQNALAQKMTVAGTVYDASGEALMGATVREAGTANGVATDMDGKFTLTCDQSSQLEISYVGYLTKKVKAGKDIKVVLEEDAKMLAETVVVGVGYGTMRKNDLTGSIASVNAKDLKHGVITSAEQMLQGKVAGLSVVQASGSPENGASIRLRGGTSLSASNSPLIVVDGIPGVVMNSVQPSEIQSIDVLKDASAAAIYGSRGANGVIIVTTNRQSSDAESINVQYNGYVAVASQAKYLDILSANQWRGFVRENNILDALDYGADTDWQKELTRTAISHSHNILFSNTRKNSGYHASLTYQNNQGVVKRNYFTRLAGSLSAFQKLMKGKLRLEEAINANFDTWHPTDGRIFERAFNLNPTVPVYNPDGSFTQISGTNTENPVELLTKRNDDHKRHRFLGYFKADYELLPGLTASANLSYEFNQATSGMFKPNDAKMEGQSEKGWGQRTEAEYTNRQLETYLTYDKSFADIHHLNVLGGYSYMDNVAEGFGATRSGFDTNAFIYNNLGAGTDYRQGDVYSYKNSCKLISFYGRVNYGLMDKYMITATVRRDGSSRFGADHKWGTFPSVSVAWRIINEKFMEGTHSWLDNLKLRVGYGITGNQNGVDPYKSLSVLSSAGASYYDAATGTWKNSYVQAQNANPDLKWESTAQFNVGIDFGFLNRINGSLEFYHKKTSDLLWTYPVPQPPYLVGTMLANVGDMVNKGVELTLGANIVRTKDFSLSANASLAYNKQEITKLSNSQYQAVGLQAGSLHNIRGLSGVYSQVIEEGYAAGEFYGYVCQGIDENGNYILKQGEDGQPVKEHLGSAMPKWNLGLSINMAYKDFDLTLAGYGMFGHKILNATKMELYDSTRLPAQNTLDDFLTSGVKQGAIFSDYFLESGNFFRMQTVTLGYNVPGVKKIGLSKVRFYLTAENLFTITSYSGMDPEVYIPDNVLSGPGIDRLIIDNGTSEGSTYSPRPRTFSLGVNVTF